MDANRPGSPSIALSRKVGPLIVTPCQERTRAAPAISATRRGLGSCGSDPRLWAAQNSPKIRGSAGGSIRAFTLSRLPLRAALKRPCHAPRDRTTPASPNRTEPHPTRPHRTEPRLTCLTPPDPAEPHRAKPDLTASVHVMLPLLGGCAGDRRAARCRPASSSGNCGRSARRRPPTR